MVLGAMMRCSSGSSFLLKVCFFGFRRQQHIQSGRKGGVRAAYGLGGLLVVDGLADKLVHPDLVLVVGISFGDDERHGVGGIRFLW